MGNQFVDLVTLGEELGDLQTVKSAVPQKKIPGLITRKGKS
jgi:hypothetical protein